MKILFVIDTFYTSNNGTSISAQRYAANIANLRPDRLSHVGLFSPVLHRDQLPVATADSTLSTSDFRPSTIYHIYVGKQDPSLYGNFSVAVLAVWQFLLPRGSFLHAHYQQFMLDTAKTATDFFSVSIPSASFVETFTFASRTSP